MSTLAKLSLAEYEKIVAAGVWNWPNNRNIELIRGELLESKRMSPAHADFSSRLSRWSFNAISDRPICVRTHNPVAFAELASEPEPDIVWVQEKSYFKAHPTAADVLLIIEVAENNLDLACLDKIDLYAEAGVGEYWIVNLVERIVEVRRDPLAGFYRSVQIFAAGESIHPLAVPSATLQIDQLFK